MLREECWVVEFTCSSGDSGGRFYLKLVLVALTLVCRYSAMSNRRSFTAAFKRNVILYAEATNNCAAQRHFHISEKMVRGWRSQRDQIFACNSQRRAFRGPTRGRYDDLEKELCSYIESERTKGIRLTCDDIQARARQLAMRDGIDRSTFCASRGWAQRFLRRNGLSLRRKPRSSSQWRPPEPEAQSIEFGGPLFEDQGQQFALQGDSRSSTPVIKVEPPEDLDITADTASDIFASICGTEEEILPFGQEREQVDVTLSGSPAFAVKVEPPDNADELASPLGTGADGMEGGSMDNRHLEGSILCFAELYGEGIAGGSGNSVPTVKTEPREDADLGVAALPGALEAVVQSSSDCTEETIVPSGEVQSVQAPPPSSESQVSTIKAGPCEDGSGEHEEAHGGGQDAERPPSHIRSSKAFTAKARPVPSVRCHLKERIYCCHICLKQFAVKGKLVLHLRVHTNELPFECDVCSKSFLERRHLTAHKKTHLGRKLHRCHLCPRAFSREHLLLEHLRKSTVRHQYKCTKCPAVCDTASELQRHVVSHTRQRGLRRDTCAESFVSATDLAVHSSTHTGELPFECGWCRAAFETEGQLRIHAAAHASERPFECDLCSVAFRTSYNLERHRRTHAKERPVEPREDRERTLSADCEAERREEAPSRKRALKCSRCVTTFHDGSALLRHFKMHTNGEP